MRGLNKKLQLILTKKFLIQEYIRNKKSPRIIANEINCSFNTIRNYLNLHNIPIRTMSEAKKGKNSFLYIDGRSSKKYYCIEEGCNNEITYETWKYGSRRCKFCCCKGKLNFNYNEEKHKKHYCIEPNCNNEICYDTWKYGKGKCQSCLGKKMTGKIGKATSGYIDGRTPLTILIRHLLEYNQWRNKVFERNNYTCQKCGRIGGNLEAHHKKSFAILLDKFLYEYNQFSPIEDKETLVRLAIRWSPFWEVNNGKTLCKDCHNLIRKQRR